jgi:hypothetical protein
MTGLIPFPPFTIKENPSNVGIRWGIYVEKFENLINGLGIDNNKRKKALLLHYAGDEVFEIYKTFPTLYNADNNYDDMKKELSDYFQPQKNTEFLRFELGNVTQQDKSIDEYVTQLRQKARDCEFADPDSQIKTQFKKGLNSNKLRTRCLEGEKPLKDLITMCRTAQIATQQATVMEGNAAGEVLSNQQSRSRRRRRLPNTHVKKEQSQQRDSQRKCTRCGGNFPHQDSCPAFGKKCNACGKKNNFKSVCRTIRSVNVRSFQENEFEEISEEEIYEDALFGLKVNSTVLKCKVKKTPRVKININNKVMDITVDTGSTLNTLNKLNPRPKMEKSKVKAYAYGQTKPVNFVGKCVCEIANKNKITIAEFYIVHHGES